MNAQLQASPLRLRRHRFIQALRPGTPLEVYGLFMTVTIVLAVVAAPLIAPFDPIAQDVTRALQPPSAEHWLGTDQLGRDIFSRLLHGGRNSLLIAVLIVGVAGTVGVLVGAIAGFVGGIVDEVFMRVVDVFLAFPSIMLALAISAALGPSLRNAAFAVAAAWWPVYARLVRGQVLVVKEREFVRASRALGASSPRLLLRAILPNSLGVMRTIFILDVGYAILAGSTLGFLGLGVSAPNPEWGLMIRDALQYSDRWWLILSPGLAIILFVSAVNFAGGVLTRSIYERSR